MNNDCHGDFFKAYGTWYYRCIGDGRVVKDLGPDAAACPLCKRPIRADNVGEVEVHTRVVREVTFQSGTNKVTFDLSNAVEA